MRCLSHVTGYRPIRDQYFLIRSVPRSHQMLNIDTIHTQYTADFKVTEIHKKNGIVLQIVI